MVQKYQKQILKQWYLHYWHAPRGASIVEWNKFWSFRSIFNDKVWISDSLFFDHNFVSSVLWVITAVRYMLQYFELHTSSWSSLGFWNRYSLHETLAKCKLSQHNRLRPNYHLSWTVKKCPNGTKPGCGLVWYCLKSTAKEKWCFQRKLEVWVLFLRQKIVKKWAVKTWLFVAVQTLYFELGIFF